ncbi:type II toxin-antitoxin system VapC family toxin [Sphaerospermopsis sp. FACHB-1194]|uniref:type II toxin-antitoxin system VapC family toxin n=1 Tax=Sphaerospermopsis sp. FACHB-1194 TaxID=2692862 RepID=UPI0016812AEE|nr:type II toxin-antitoxin system VapC family toxin [Sphaerospermopsis sp. FACHB-1194]MBD2143866.1 type II toxin-antitoxin system VapC family toxin [Sphaerospermopsis sp. FACHB-1194]
MTRYIIDTNVVMRFCNPSDVQHHLATDAISRLLTQGDKCFLTAQILVEFWAVATRPVEVNGLGWSVETTRKTIDQVLRRFPLLKESEDIFPNWLNLVTTNKVMGKRTHDVRIVAVMLAYQVTHILTFNPSDFLLTTSIVVVRPQELLS